MLFVDKIKKDFLPFENELLVVKHPGFLLRKRDSFQYENSKDSTAYIDDNTGELYFMGGLNGGNTIAFLNLVSQIKKNIDIDFSNKIIAKWHDESHLNHYLLTSKHKILPEYYVQIEDVENLEKPKIIIRDKNKFGGHNYLRDVKINNFTKLLKLLKIIVKKILRR